LLRVALPKLLPWIFRTAFDQYLIIYICIGITIGGENLQGLDRVKERREPSWLSRGTDDPIQRLVRYPVEMIKEREQRNEIRSERNQLSGEKCLREYSLMMAAHRKIC
jgi:hypothetical protein